MKPEADRLPMKVKYSALFSYARHVTREGQMTADGIPYVFGRLRWDLSNGIIPQWGAMSWDRPQAVISHSGLIWYIQQDLHRPHRGVVTRIEAMPQ